MTGAVASGGTATSTTRTVTRPASSDHRCDSCGYQIATAPPFPLCPMCGTRDWKEITAERRPDLQVARV